MKDATRRSLAGLAFLALSLGSPNGTRAEVFTDVFLGIGLTADSVYTSNGEEVPPSFLCLQECSTAVSPAGGIRVGYWFERVPWLGVAGDVSGFMGAWGIQSPITVTALPISAVVLMRLQLVRTEELPEGRLQPYIAFGPTLMTTFATRTEGSNNPLLINLLPPLQSWTDTSFDVGADARLGARILADDFISIVLEYRFTYTKPSWQLGSSDDPQNISTSLATSQVTLGLGLHFR